MNNTVCDCTGCFGSRSKCDEVHSSHYEQKKIEIRFTINGVLFYAKNKASKENAL